jgi:hypothetical protein
MKEFFRAAKNRVKPTAILRAAPQNVSRRTPLVQWCGKLQSAVRRMPQGRWEQHHLSAFVYHPQLILCAVCTPTKSSPADRQAIVVHGRREDIVLHRCSRRPREPIDRAGNRRACRRTEEERKRNFRRRSHQEKVILAEASSDEEIVSSATVRREPN